MASNATIPSEETFENKGKGKGVAEGVPAQDTAMDEDEEDDSDDEHEEVSFFTFNLLAYSRHMVADLGRIQGCRSRYSYPRPLEIFCD